MFGLFLIIFVAILLIGLVILGTGSYNYGDLGIGITIISGFIIVVMLLCVPACKLDDRQNVEYITVFQKTLDAHRTEDLSSFERFQIIEEINEINGKIASYKTKGQKWYNNKWIYDESFATLNYIK